MKYRIPTLLLALLPFSGFCQDSDNAGAFKAGDNLINLGIGLGEYTTYGGGFGSYSVGVPLHASYERGITDNISAGVGFDYVKYTFTNPPPINDKQELSYSFISLRGAYHFNNLLSKVDLANKNIDVYAGLALGFVIADMEYTSTNPFYPSFSDTNYDVDAGLFLGIKYYFTQNIGLMMEVGPTGTSYLRFGLGLKF